MPDATTLCMMPQCHSLSLQILQSEAPTGENSIRKTNPIIQ